MTLSISSCLNHFQPIPNSSSKSQPTHLPWKLEEKERSWKRQCMIGAACIILSFPIPEALPAEINLISWGDHHRHHNHHHHQVASASASSELKKVVERRWSDKRSCPPWRINSLETIVPENLPRPSARRRWEATGFSGSETQTSNSPQVSRTAANLHNYSTKCFSL